jgi:hypothetical protein
MGPLHSKDLFRILGDDPWCSSFRRLLWDRAFILKICFRILGDDPWCSSFRRLLWDRAFILEICFRILGDDPWCSSFRRLLWERAFILEICFRIHFERTRRHFIAHLYYNPVEVSPSEKKKKGSAADSSFLEFTQTCFQSKIEFFESLRVLFFFLKPLIGSSYKNILFKDIQTFIYTKIFNSHSKL